MPELPEVESTVRYLRDRIVGLRIAETTLGWKRTLDRPSAREFDRRMRGCRVHAVDRRGKFIVMALRDSRNAPLFLLGHLRMSGSIDVVAKHAPVSKHDRLLLHFENGKDLRFNDPRKFGRFYLVPDATEVTARLGVEPLDETFTEELFFQQLRSKHGRIKPLLLNQAFLAGVGNIYADESLWRARIHPKRRAQSVTRTEAGALLRELRATLREAIELQGTDAGDGVVEYGSYEPRVYARENLPCHRCGTAIRRIVLGQRGTHFCPACQRGR